MSMSETVALFMVLGFVFVVLGLPFAFGWWLRGRRWRSRPPTARQLNSIIGLCNRHGVKRGDVPASVEDASVLIEWLKCGAQGERPAIRVHVQSQSALNDDGTAHRAP